MKTAQALLFISFWMLTNIYETCSKDFLTLTLNEKAILDLFRVTAKNDIKVPKDYMTEEIFLLRFLRQTNFNLRAAEHLLKEMIRWREENNIDTLLDEEYPEFDDEYGIYLEGCDYEGRPVISMPLGDWDMRRAMVSGLGPKLNRYMDKVMEDATTFLRNANAAGMEIVQNTLIIDMSGFHAVTHVCPQCIQIYIYFLSSLQNHYPGLIEKLYFVNTPEIFNTLWNLYQGVFNEKLREIAKFYGRNKEEWMAALRNEIPPNQLSRRYGGNKPIGMELYYIRMAGQIIANPTQLKALNFTLNCAKDLDIYANLVKEVHHEPGFRKSRLPQCEI